MPFFIGNLKCYKELKELDWLNNSLGTLGGGNHFIEIDVDENDNKYLVIHTGSRNLGKQVAEIYQNKAIEYCSYKKEMLEEKNKIIKEYKEQGKQKEIQKALIEINNKYNGKTKLPKDLCYLEGKDREDYLHDMKLCQEFALLNRSYIAYKICKEMSILSEDYFQCIHNYINFEDNIVRKGSISARKGEKVIIPMFTSPVLGFSVGFTVMLLIAWFIYKIKARPDAVNKNFRKLQLLSAGLMALSHGSNDAQKTMGIITLALLAGGNLKTTPAGDFDIPIYVILACALTMACGTMNGGWKIIKTMGDKIIRLKPVHGFAAETTAAGLILTASHFGIPLSTTHVISTSIMGVGSTFHAHAVKWRIVGNIVIAWVLTIPVCVVISALIYNLIYKIV